MKTRFKILLFAVFSISTLYFISTTEPTHTKLNKQASYEETYN